MKIEIELIGTQDLLDAFAKFENGIIDLRQLGAWDAVASEFHKIEKAIFSTEGAAGKSGKWNPLQPIYARRKLARWGPVPILQASGRLYRSLTSRNTGDSVFDKQPMEMTIGSSVPYGTYHQRGTGKMPRRPPLDLTPEHEKQLAKPIQQKLRQLIANARLREKRGF